MPVHRSTSRRRFLQLGALSGSLALAPTLGLGPFTPSPARAEPSTAAAVKTRATYYTAEKIAAARRNIEQYAWARTLRDTAVTGAEHLTALEDEAIWSLMSSQGVPRSYAVNQDLGSPITGTDIYDHGAYPWLADPYTEPWKIKDPSSDYVFPTNDFAAYYASGLDDHGNFSRETADPQFLVNKLYPDRGETWGVDDGFGWVDDNGDKWTFIAYYNHWFVWYNPFDQFGVLGDGLRDLTESYIYTGEAKYAHAGLILLDRIADLYPAMDTSIYKREDGYLASDGLRGRGKAIGSIWETGLARALVQAYDAFYPAIADGDDAGVVEFLTAKATQYGLNPKDSPEAIRSNIENGIIRQIFPAVQEAQIFGNFGMHQSVLALAAVVLDEKESSTAWLDFVFAAGGLEGSPDWVVTGGNVGPTLINIVDRDGWSNEAAPGYNNLPISHIKSIADCLAGNDLYPVADIYANPKYRAMMEVRPRLTMLNAYTPSIGDSGQTGKPMLLGSTTDHVVAFEKYGGDVAAQMAYMLNGNSVDELYSDIYALDIPGVQAAIQKVIDSKGELNLPSENQTGFGFAALRTGEAETMRGLTVYYGSNTMHGHKNALFLDLFGHGVDLTPGLGYPSYADSKALRREWESNTVASNTVVVDAAPNKVALIGRPMGFGDAGGVRWVDAEAPKVYPQTSRYRRTSTMIDIDADDSYVVDVFRVDGGSEHVFSFHAGEGSVTTEGLDLVAQPKGNYAGPDVPAPDPLGAPRPGASGFDYLTNVERAKEPKAGFQVDWKIVDTYDVHESDPDLHVRLTMLTSVQELALADGVPPQNKPGNPGSLRYALAKREGTDLTSQFVSVIEGYRDGSKVASSTVVPVETEDGGAEVSEVAAVRVELVSGRVDYVIHDPAGDRLLLIDGKIIFNGIQAVVSLEDGEPVRATMTDVTRLAVRGSGATIVRGRQPRLKGSVQKFTTELEDTNAVEVALERDWSAFSIEPKDLVGRYVYVEDDGERNAVYEITDVAVSGARTLTVTTDSSFIRAYADDDDLEAGYTYDIAKGRAAHIPLLATWEA